MRIEGYFGAREVVVDGVLLDPQPSQALWNHSPDGFNWGYAGSGPAQLALALLMHAGVEPRRAVELHQALKFDFVQHLPQASFDVEFDLAAWLAKTGRGF